MEALVKPNQGYSQSQSDIDLLTGKEVDSQLLTYLQGVKNEDKLASLSILLEDLRGMNLDDVDSDVRDLVENQMGLPLGDVSLLERAAEAVHYRLREISSSESYQAHVQRLTVKQQIRSLDHIAQQEQCDFTPVFQGTYEGLVQFYSVLLGIGRDVNISDYTKIRVKKSGIINIFGNTGHLENANNQTIKYKIKFIPIKSQDSVIEDLKIKINYSLNFLSNSFCKDKYLWWKTFPFTLGFSRDLDYVFTKLNENIAQNPELIVAFMEDLVGLPNEVNNFLQKRREKMQTLQDRTQKLSMVSNVNLLETTLQGSSEPIE